MLFAVWLKKQSGKPLSLLLFIGFTFISLNADAQQVTLSGKNLSFEKVLKEIRNQTGFNFVCKDEWAKDIGPVTMEVNNVSVEEVLRTSLRGKPYIFTIVNKMITIFPAPIRINITGKVMDNNHHPLAGVSVTVKGSQVGTSTNQEGEFLLRNIDPKSVLLFSYVGFDQLRENVNGRNQIFVKMVQQNKQLDEAVVYNGYQKIKQKYLTGSVTSLKMDSILQPGLNTVDKMLEGRVPGLMFMQNSGQAGAAPKLRIRGTSTYLGSREPLWVVDGIIRTNPIPIPPERINDPDFVNLLGNAISGLNPYDIEQIDILKDATAAALYGVRAANGVIVITTKRGKPGPPTVNYNVTGTFTRRPRYTDRAVYMMDSRERIDVSREMIEKQMKLRGGAMEAYEKAIVEYYGGQIDYDAFKQRVNKAESLNTDWLGNTMRDVFATNHTLSVSGGSPSASYRASVGYRTEPGVIKKESNDLYTGMLNLQMNYRKFKVEFNVQLSKENRRYTPAEIGLLNYAYGTSRAIPLHNEDGSRYFYSTISSDADKNNFRDFKAMNILNEMDHTGETIGNNEYNASIDLSYEIAKGIQFRSKLAYTSGNSSHQTWFEEKTEWAAQIRANAYDPVQQIIRPEYDPMPFGGELREQTVKRQNYIINGRLQFSRFLDQRQKHQLTAEVAADLISNQANTFEFKSRGYYPGRGHSFAQTDPAKYPAFGNWLKNNSNPFITKSIQNAIRPYLTSTYIFNDRYVITAITSQEFSNSFGSRSNEKFLPTWALSGRWNLHEDLLRNLPWVDRAALLVSFGTRGNMLSGQTPYAIISKGSINTNYNALSSTVVSFPNRDLAWEKTQDYNGTLEFSLLKGRFNASLGYFYIKTSNAFLEKKVSAVNGAPGNSYVVNGGVLENQGVELSLHFKVIDNIGAGNKRGFMWRFDPQLGQVFNKLINNNLNSRNVMVDAATLTYQDFLNGLVPVNGKSVNTFYSYRFKSLDPNNGSPVFYGAEPGNKEALHAAYNKLTKEEAFSMVMVESGKREPVLQGGINNSFMYGNWTLNITFTYSVGNKIRLMQIASGNYGTFRPSSQQNLRKEFTNRWRYPGDEQFTNIPGIQGAPDQVSPDMAAWWLNPAYALTYPFATDYYQMYDFSDLRVVKGDYLKLQYVSLSYRLPNELCRRLQCKGATALISGSNLFTIAHKALRGQDPGQSGSSPNINLSIRPVYSLNLNISF